MRSSSRCRAPIRSSGGAGAGQEGGVSPRGDECRDPVLRSTERGRRGSRRSAGFTSDAWWEGAQCSHCALADVSPAPRRAPSGPRSCAGSSPSTSDGKGDRAIAAALNRDRIACPLARKPERNRHRLADGQQASTVRVILDNPRYTGFAVFGRWTRHETLLDPEDVAARHGRLARRCGRGTVGRRPGETRAALCGTPP
ncbi:MULTISPECIES: recombinase family protein [Actinoalloteichus]|uniref:recombinase family protein n=1 Tax=Actinoalloteichus TaxID=65496 RepID=UPI001E4DE217|nr:MULTISPECIES: recombinase family protein [Actinoalloteichus]